MSEDYEDREGFVFTFPGLAGAADDVCVTGQRRRPPRDGLVRLHPSAAPYLLREWALDRNTAPRLERLSRAALGRNVGLRGAPYGLTRILEPLIRAFDVETLVVWGPKRIAVAEPAVFPAEAAAPVHRPDEPMSTTWFQVKVLDDLGRPVDGVALFFDLPSGKRQLITNSTGVARLDGVVEGDGSVRFADLPALREKLHSRWRDVHGKPAPFRPAPADEPDVVFVPLADHIEAHPLRFETPLTIVLLPVVLRVRLVGLYFDTDKTFLLPSAMHGIRRMRKFYERYPNMELLIVGHTDQNGDPQYNDELSLLRAKSVKQFLTDDVDGWMKWYEPETPWSRRWGTSEDRRMLETLPEAAPPYLGAGDSYYHAITRFQADKGLPTSGLADAQTRRALVADYMALDHTTLPAGVQVTIRGCGEAFPEVAGDVSGPSDARDAANRRVELYLFDGPVYPAPDGPISGPTAVDYPAWRHYLIETYDFSVDDPPLHTFRIRMHDARRQRLLPSSFAAIGPAAEIYRADADAWIEFELHDEDALVAIQWGADDPAGPFPFRASIYVVFDEEPNLRARAQLHNLGYPALQDFDYAVWRFEVDNHLPENGLYDGVVAPTTRARLEQIYTPENCDAVK